MRSRNSTFLALWLVAIALTVQLPVRAQSSSMSTPPPCLSTQHRQFDFWLGAWDVSDPKGKLVGHSRIDSILGGCVLLENWDSTSAFAGKSFNLYNGDTGRWEQFWVDQTGSRLHLVGGLIGNEMVLRGIQDKPDARSKLARHERITWTPNADGSVRQLWETSNDDGKTWAVNFDGLYRRAATASQDD